jgi:hypothetical protein
VFVGSYLIMPLVGGVTALAVEKFNNARDLFLSLASSLLRFFTPFWYLHHFGYSKHCRIFLNRKTVPIIT